jgi:hypothetical protein
MIETVLVGSPSRHSASLGCRGRCPSVLREHLNFTSRFPSPALLPSRLHPTVHPTNRSSVMVSSLSINNGIPWDSVNNDYIALSCETYNLTYMLPSTSQPYQTQINLRSEDIACNVTTDARFWFISPMLQPGSNGTIMWSFLNDIPAGKRYRLEISDQNGLYAMTETFLVGYTTAAQDEPSCLSGSLIDDTPIYHLPQSQRGLMEASLNNSSPEWHTCVPAQFLNADDVAPAGGSTSATTTSSSHRAPIFWFLVIGLPIITIVFFAYLAWIAYARKQRSRKTARNASAVNRAVRSSISKSWPSPSQHTVVSVPLEQFDIGQFEKDDVDNKDVVVYSRPPYYRTQRLSFFLHHILCQ